MGEWVGGWVNGWVDGLFCLNSAIVNGAWLAFSRKMQKFSFESI